MRTVGVEEELLLVDSETGRPRSVASQILERTNVDSAETRGGSLDHELHQQQLETDTPPSADLEKLERDVRAWRDLAIAHAREAGARVVAAGTSPLPVEPQVVHDPRYEEMVERFGLTTSEQLTCGCHVHVSISSADEAVGVLDRIRVWLPSLLALSANSPFWQGVDSRYASFRSQAMIRWPTAGPHGIFGSAQRYRELVDKMLSSGVILDAGMIYFDSRLSHHYPTVEIRVADVCLDASDTVLIAALCRGLVETAAQHWQSGQPPPGVDTALLRLATWQAGREGIEGSLLDPLACKPRPAREIVTALVEHVRPALYLSGDEAMVDERVERVFARGNGAQRQRAVLEKTGKLVDVVADLARVTAGQERS